MSIGQTASGIWYVQYREKGIKNPRREYFGRGEKGEALAAARDTSLKAAKKKQSRDEGKMYLDTLTQAYLAERKLAGASKRWLQEVVRLFNRTLLPYLCHSPVDDLRYTDIALFFDKAFTTQKLATKQRYLAYLKAVFSFGVRYDLTLKNPLAQWRRKKEPRRPMPLRLPDLKKLVEVAPPHLAWALRVEWELGTRPGVSELFKITYAHVDYDRCLIHIPGTKNASSDRVIPITSEFCRELRETKKTSVSGRLIEFEGKPVKSLKTALKTARKNAGIPYHVRMYDIRHLFVSAMLAGGADLAAVSRLVGHSSIATTQAWYYHVMPGEMVRAIDSKPKL